MGGVFTLDSGWPWSELTVGSGVILFPRHQGPSETSDWGANFVSACKELKIPSNNDNSFYWTKAVNVSSNLPMPLTWMVHGREWLVSQGKILDSMFLQLGSSKLTHSPHWWRKGPLSSTPDLSYLCPPIQMIHSYLHRQLSALRKWASLLHQSVTRSKTSVTIVTKSNIWLKFRINERSNIFLYFSHRGSGSLPSLTFSLEALCFSRMTN